MQVLRSNLPDHSPFQGLTPLWSHPRSGSPCRTQPLTVGLGFRSFQKGSAKTCCRFHAQPTEFLDSLPDASPPGEEQCTVRVEAACQLIPDRECETIDREVTDGEFGCGVRAYELPRIFSAIRTSTPSEGRR